MEFRHRDTETQLVAHKSTGCASVSLCPCVQRLSAIFDFKGDPSMKKGAEEAAKRLNVDLVVQAAEREVDVEKQMQIVENLIQTHVAALCVTPSGSREIVPAIDKANKANIPVVIVDTRVDAKALADSGGKVATFIGSDNYEGGKIAGEFLAKHLNGRGKGAVL